MIMHGSHRHQPRPASEQVQDLHVYVIPPELWRQNLRSAANEVIADSISLGFLRVSPHTYLNELRSEIVEQLGDEYLPKDYTFLKSVGRCLTQVKGRQERDLKVKHFLPPYAYAPELFILDAHADNLRDSPSTIYPQSLNGQSLTRTASKTDSGFSRDPKSDRGGGSYKYPSYNYDVAPPIPGGHTPRHDPQSHYPASDGQHYGSQVFDQNAQMKSSYPTYSQPYSHDISALTNAHRNQVDNHRQPYNDGAETYRKYNDDSSGYRSIPSPRKVSESPPRVHGGDNSMSRKLNQGSSRPADNQSDLNGYSSPSHKQLRQSGVSELDRTDTEIISEPQTSRTEKQQPNSRYDGGRNGESPTRRPDGTANNNRTNGVRDSRGEDAGPEPSHTYGRDTDDREMMSATPTTAAAAAAAASQGYNRNDPNDPSRTQQEEGYSNIPRSPTNPQGPNSFKPRPPSKENVQVQNNQNGFTPRPPSGLRINVQRPSNDQNAPLVTKSLNAPLRRSTLLEVPSRDIRSQNSQAINGFSQKSPLKGIQTRSQSPEHAAAPHSSRYTSDISTTDRENLSEERLALLRELEKAREERLYSERKREDLVKKARSMQTKTNNRRNQAREVWKKKYYEAKKQTPSLETDCQKSRVELDSVHKKYLSALENNKVNTKQKDNHQLDAAKIQYEVDELQRRADAAKMKLTAEMKLRNQAETELRALRAELTQKKMNMNLSRTQKMNSLGNSVNQSSGNLTSRGPPPISSN